jgi:hypothetical protein
LLMVNRWDVAQVPLKWTERPKQGEMFDAA